MTSRKHNPGEVERDRLGQAGELTADLGEGWQNEYRPGSAGCHELLDRTALLSDMLERYILDHPACVANSDWYLLAEQAAVALRELYQEIGGEHLVGKEGHRGLKSVFAEFGRLLTERLKLGVLATEDTIRYSFYFALLSSGGIRHTDLTLEYPHPALLGAKVDTVISAGSGHDSVAFEFKYDRANPGGANQNRTQRAGKALNDLFRLVRLPAEVAALKYFVYVTDDEMARYFRNPVNRLRELFELAEGAQYAIVAGTFQEFSQTLTATIEPFFSECVVTGAFAANLPGNHCLRIFQVSAPAVSAPRQPTCDGRENEGQDS